MSNYVDVKLFGPFFNKDFKKKKENYINQKKFVGINYF